MTISANRFKTLSEETNVAVSDFVANKSSSIFNSPNNQLKEITASVEEFFTNLVQGKLPNLDSSLVDEGKRATKDLFGGIKDVSKFTTRDIDDAIAEVLPDNPAVQGIFRQIASQCKTRAFNPVGFGKPFDIAMPCGAHNSSNSSGGCNPSQFSNVLNRLTDGAYNTSFNDFNNVLRQLVALASYGYSMNMCGVFSAVANGVTQTNVLNRASAILMGTLSSEKNTLGLLDLASASINLKPTLENPGGITSFFTSYNQPRGIKERDLSGNNGFAERVLGAAEIFDENWNKSSEDGILSVAKLGGKNDQLDQLLHARVLDNVADEDHLDTVFASDLDFMKTAFAFAA